MAGTGWLRDSVIYQIFLPSFADGDGDGIGDLTGAIAHLDHLEWLGIDAVWFSPCSDCRKRHSTLRQTAEKQSFT